MKLAYSLCLTVSVCTLAVNNCVVASPLDTSHMHTQHTLGLKPISSLEDSYNLAAAVFLPDFEDSIGFGGNTLDDDVARRDNCAGFALASCPAHAKCSKCTFDTKYKITGCDTDYKISGNACIAKSCAEINASYKADVPTNQICNITNTSVRTCYSSCRAVNTSGYPLDTCPSGAVCTTAPDCTTSATTKGNCSPVKQKVTDCTSSTQKVNSAATACIDKDDTCPSNYFKSCETGTQGDPKYTERGSACYQCKPACNTAIYKYNTTNCTSPKQLAGTECGGNYDKCEIPCGSEYIYDESNCPSEKNALCGENCNGKYTKCIAKPYTVAGYGKTSFNYGGMLFGDKKVYINSEWVLNCPDSKDNFDFYNRFNGASAYPTTTFDGYHACYTGDRACLDIYMKLLDEGEASLEKNVNCGNLDLHLFPNYSIAKTEKYILNGNNYVMTFDKPTGYDLRANSKPFEVNNIKIIHNNSHPISYETCSQQGESAVFYGPVTVTNAEVYANGGLAKWGVSFYGTNKFILGKNIIGNSELYSTDSTTNNPYPITSTNITLYGTLDIKTFTDKNSPQTMIDFSEIGTNGKLNFKGQSHLRFSPKNDAKVNLCFTDGFPKSRYEMFSSTVAKENIRANTNSIGFIGSAGGNYSDKNSVFAPDLCNEEPFNNAWWD